MKCCNCIAVSAYLWDHIDLWSDQCKSGIMADGMERNGVSVFDSRVESQELLLPSSSEIAVL